MRNLSPPVLEDVSSAPPCRAEIVRLFGQSAEQAVRLAYHLTRDREAALDLTQEAFVKAMESLPALADPARAAAWFHRITVNLCRDWVRRQGAERRALKGAAELPERRTHDPAEQAERNEARRLLRRALMSLPLEYREAVALVCVEGYAPNEAAEVLGVPDGTLRWRLHEGRKMLRDEFAKLTGGDE